MLEVLVSLVILRRLGRELHIYSKAVNSEPTKRKTITFVYKFGVYVCVCVWMCLYEQPIGWYINR